MGAPNKNTAGVEVLDWEIAYDSRDSFSIFEKLDAVLFLVNSDNDVSELVEVKWSISLTCSPVVTSVGVEFDHFYGRCPSLVRAKAEESI